MSTESFEDFIFMNQIENELDFLFEAEMSDPKQLIVINKDEILNEFKKYADFWLSKRLITTGLIHPAKNKEIFYRNNYTNSSVINFTKKVYTISNIDKQSIFR